MLIKVVAYCSQEATVPRSNKSRADPRRWPPFAGLRESVGLRGDLSGVADGISVTVAAIGGFAHRATMQVVCAVITDLKFFTFGFGRRVCPGQHVANRSIFINTAVILWAFCWN
ncbi:uncharacterized protein F5891DRAFT_1199019 [Suillus fuscotomentosus]|uniref:Cytochrome P450 n=1 Tax=Suillus fuscotomentosus TaxID=1912939 RepID=A0AAD4DPZ9_9AGAM|nr:uncharacterized protein F5891DRAFT_1199019 [Suillus fuscotomentosus]KAG1888963.1 hypothetical protein F5891DRAFT_1199019 [Suillus fuscotomentosus]